MKSQKILVIDDDISTINIIIDYLEVENPNYVFFYAINGTKGIVAAEKHQPQLIITDWEMPGLSGIETIKKLKDNEQTKNIPVIMLTGIMTSSKNLETALAAGAIDYIRKPIDKIELKARIKSMLILSDYYKQIVNLKNRELASTAINILQNNEFNIKTIEKIKSIEQKFCSNNKKLSRELRNVNKDISFKVKGESWEHFKNYFQKVHPNFTKNLVAKFPTLTPAELKLSILLRLNLSTKEIASIIFITPDSVKTSRNRLRKKINLPSSDNLVAFLLSV